MKVLERLLMIGALVLGIAALIGVVNGTDARARAPDLQRGQRGFLAYCAMCHGDGGAGDGELASGLARRGVVVAHLDDDARMKKLGWAGVRRVIVTGGAHTGRSNLMPAWGEKLAPDLVNDITEYVMALPSRNPPIPEATIRKYLEAPPGAPEQGRRLFVHTCSACHGPFGKGDGTLAETLRKRHNIRPRNLTDSTYIAKKTDQQLFATISLGGGHMKKSPYMPAWTVTLSPEQIKDVVSYIRVISRTAPQR